MISYDTPRLIADIGGTFARFALETAPGRFEHGRVLRCADHADFHSAVRAYLDETPVGHLSAAAIAIATPVEGDRVQMTNYHWQFSIEQMRERLELNTLVVVNDFTALAMAVPRLGASDIRQVGDGYARKASVIGVLGAGSGLGVSGLIPASDGWVALGTEGGHASFAPHDEREVAILRHAWQRYSHVSFERLLSGPGLELIHQALATHTRVAASSLTAPEITRRALEGGDALCKEAVDVFCGLLGTAAGNLAVTLGALGGIYIGGSIVPRLGVYFDRSPFRRRFEDKGRFSEYLQGIPTIVITAESATFLGASSILAAQLKSASGEGGPLILEQIQRSVNALSPAERRVASHVLAHPRAVLNDPIADIAKAAGVSQPTVIRFCRSLGCEGLSDFKLRLASSLTGTAPVTHAQVTDDDSPVELGAKVLGNTALAILQVRDQINRDQVEQAIELLHRANRIEFHAIGYYGSVAQDAQFKFLRFGIASMAYTDTRLQGLAAAALRAGDVAVLISGSGRVPELIEVAERARERGAAVIAITASQSPLARKADVSLIVDHTEDLNTQLPMISRILHLLIIDILAVGLAMRRSEGTGLLVEDAEGQPIAEEAAASDGGPAVSRRRGSPGVSAALPLTGLTSHSRK